MADLMNKSILTSIKKMLGMTEDYEAFDTDIVIHINSVFATLHQLGVGQQDTAFSITGKEETWDQFITADKLNSVISYMYLKVKTLFDPPTSSFVLESYKEQIKEYEWRLNVAAEEENS